MYVVYEAPLVMVSDYPEAYKGQPGFEFIERVPTVWDDTKVLDGEVGRYITIARQKDGAWYIGSMTNWDQRDLDIPLTFLGAASSTHDLRRWHRCRRGRHERAHHDRSA